MFFWHNTAVFNAWDDILCCLLYEWYEFISLKAFLWYNQALFYLWLKVWVSIKLEAILSFIHYEERREERILQSGPTKYSLRSGTTGERGTGTVQPGPVHPSLRAPTNVQPEGVPSRVTGMGGRNSVHPSLNTNSTTWRRAHQESIRSGSQWVHWWGDIQIICRRSKC